MQILCELESFLLELLLVCKSVLVSTFFIYLFLIYFIFFYRKKKKLLKDLYPYLWYLCCSNSFPGDVFSHIYLHLIPLGHAAVKDVPRTLLLYFLYATPLLPPPPSSGILPESCHLFHIHLQRVSAFFTIFLSLKLK